MIDAYLKSSLELDDHAIHLLFSANRWEAAYAPPFPTLPPPIPLPTPSSPANTRPSKTIHTLLASGTTVICDRYYHSGITYSAAKQNPSLSLSWARAPEVGLPRPDIVLFLDLEEAVARERGGWGGEVYEKAEMQRRVRELYWGISQGTIGREGGPPGGEMGTFRQEEEDLVLVDAGPSVEEVAEEIWRKVLPRVEAVDRGEVGSSVRLVS